MTGCVVRWKAWRQLTPRGARWCPAEREAVGLALSRMTIRSAKTIARRNPPHQHACSRAAVSRATGPPRLRAKTVWANRSRTMPQGHHAGISQSSPSNVSVPPMTPHSVEKSMGVTYDHSALTGPPEMKESTASSRCTADSIAGLLAKLLRNHRARVDPRTSGIELELVSSRTRRLGNRAKELLAFTK